MKRQNRTVPVLALGLLTGFTYALWKRIQQPSAPGGALSSAEASHLLARAVPLLRLPTSPDRPPEVLPDGSGLRCPVTGRTFPYHNGILDLLCTDQDTTFTQDFLDTSFTAWAYDRFRGWITRALSAPDFAEEVARNQRALRVQSGDTILDLACGHGNFTVEWAKRVGLEGLVIGLDLSPAMLARAAYRVGRWELDNVLLVCGDAHHLPFADGLLPKVNCSGGFHQFPNLPQVIREVARVSAGGAVLTASTFAEGPADSWVALKRWLKRRFALHFVPLLPLGEQLAAVGYGNYEWALPGGWFGYTSARKVGRNR